MSEKINYKAVFQKHQTLFSLVLLGVYFIINGAVNATTVLMEGLRQAVLPFSSWEPFVWEYTSAFSSFLLVIVLARVLRHFPWDWLRPVRSLCIYLGMALAFAAMHIVLMIISRKSIYELAGAQYDFASSPQQWIFEVVYEMQKDMWSFVFFVVAIWCYRYVVSQWLGNATNIALDALKQPETIEPPLPDNNTPTNNLLLIKKLGREFLINKQNIEWIESSGNYVNLYIGNDVFPMRTTLTAFIHANAHLSIQRVHRSFAVNLNEVDNITLLESGDGVITLKSGENVKMSRRYKLSLPLAH
ncbi:LytTR family DNA-binding domain-containing protein [Alteromonas sp. D210916BOD_24]|uniref:LytTR family DNA-binding domain-containing protein n=1 Tax=Alteromonas sp. D210916BOD_24 TaxID=3157618 RepID=UPI00399D3DA7